MSEYKEVYQNLMNIMNSIQRIQKIQMSPLTNPLTTDIIMNGYNILECNNIIANTLTSSNINTNALLTNSITSNYQSGIKINSNYPNNSGTFPLLTVTGQTTGSLTYPNNDIFKVNNDGSVIIGSYGRLITNSTVPALTVYGSIELHGPLNSTNIVSSIIGDADNGPGAITVSGTYAYKTVALANTINNINITTGAISNLYTNSSTISSLFASSGTIGNLYSNAGSISSLYVNSCSNINTNINSSTISNLISTNGTISNINININSGTVSNLNSTDSKINNLYTNSYSLSNLFGNSGTINNLQSKNATISSLFTNNGSFGNLYSNSSSIASLNTTNCTSTNIFCNSSSIGNLVSNYGTISSLYTSNLKLINLQSTPINYVIGVDGQGNINSQAVPSLNSITNVTTGTTYSLGYIPNITGSTLNVNTPNQNLNSNSITANFNGLFLTLNTTIEYPYTITAEPWLLRLISSNYIRYGEIGNNFPVETLTIKNNITYNKIGNIIYWKCNLILSTTALIAGNQIIYSFDNLFDGNLPYFILPFKYSSSLTSPILNNPTNITSLIQLCYLHHIDAIVNTVSYNGYTSTNNIPLAFLSPFNPFYNNLSINGSNTGVVMLIPSNNFNQLYMYNPSNSPITSLTFTVTLKFSGSYYTTS